MTTAGFTCILSSRLDYLCIHSTESVAIHLYRAGTKQIVIPECIFKIAAQGGSAD